MCALYGVVYVSAAFLGEKIRFIVPIFTPLIESRALVFPLFIPFYLVYFAAEGLYIHVYRERQMAGSTAGNMARTLMLKVAPPPSPTDHSVPAHVYSQYQSHPGDSRLLHRVTYGQSSFCFYLKLLHLVAIQVYGENLGGG